MEAINPTIPINTLNINGLYTPIEGDCKNGLKNNLTIYIVYKTPF